jgi:hypothetical protein
MNASLALESDGTGEQRPGVVRLPESNNVFMDDASMELKGIVPAVSPVSQPVCSNN